ncbi:mandelate racemase/muconate lactonizing enzyme family protein [Nitratireductor sp. ZSWI3]|uniref:mandelate racemase/muconate lactonizing enzyme family protein n=1 Tax=Nitratireductor sp. ZSWI3 TaxID=2966359 RepID=UPI00214F8F96|nr:mandelate racemase/muconate lactonizing enzyme family protein [Nitratireductor sp. ZSWI3]MCR4266681.1 mandelate racemase/muconate lactonizing enzyme family protein [Nitratireductor sp. ZSWI3]
MSRLSVRILVHRIPIDIPVRTSFGTMLNRPSVLLRIEDEDGHVGWGEVWCNYPAVGAEHRARLLESVILPLASETGLLGEPARLWGVLSERLRVLAIQTGETGPISQCLAGLECALQDLAARRRKLPLHRFLAAGSGNDVGVYASGINPSGAPETAARAIAAGYAGCKIKVGFDAALDRSNLHEARGAIGEGVPLMADANQAWTIEEAVAFAADVREVGLTWLEEPIAHDEPDEYWMRLAAETGARLAAGENFTSLADFAALPARRALRYLQPDVGKWGGLGMALEVAGMARAAGIAFCPHWLGGGVGLLASLHVKAAAGAGEGFVEVDFNENPMRSRLTEDTFRTLSGGRLKLSPKAGIGECEAAVAEFDDCLVLRKDILLNALPAGREAVGD